MNVIEQLKKLAIAASDDWDNCFERGLQDEGEYFRGKLSAYNVAIELLKVAGLNQSKQSIPGVPDGWEVVRFGNANEGESYVNGFGEVLLHTGLLPTQAKRLVVRKIETTEVAE